MRQSFKRLSIIFAVLYSVNLHAEDLTFPTVDCVITPSKVIEISAAVPGVVEALYVDRTQPVSKGQLLGELKADVEKANVRLAQARTEMRSELSAEQVNLKYDRLQSSRVNQLAERQLASSQNLDEAARIKQVTYWRLKQAEETLKLRELELTRSQAQLEEKKVYSTINGLVAERYKNEGEYVEEEPIFRLVQLNPLYIETVFPMRYYGKIHKGMTATIYPEIDQEKGYSVSVDLIDSLGDAASGTFGVRLILDNADHQIPAGLKCFLQLDEAQAQPAEANIKQEASSSKKEVAVVKVSTGQPKETMNTQENDRTQVSSNKASLAITESQDGGALKVEQAENSDANRGEAQKAELSELESVENESIVIKTQQRKLGPYTSQSQLLKATQILEKNDVHYTVDVVDRTEKIGYMVVSSNDYTQNTATLLTQFTKAGVKDMGPLPKSSYGGGISFGVYNGPVQAETRKVKLFELGINAEVIPRSKQVKTYWLSVDKITPSVLDRLI